MEGEFLEQGTIDEAAPGFNVLLIPAYLLSALVSAASMASAMEIASYSHGAERATALSFTEKWQHGTQLATMTSFIILLLCVPVAWFPFWITFTFFRKRTSSRTFACALAGIATAEVLTFYMTSILSFVMRGDPETAKSYITIMLDLSPLSLPAGLIGGLVFRVVAFRGVRRSSFK